MDTRSDRADNLRRFRAGSRINHRIAFPKIDNKSVGLQTIRANDQRHVPSQGPQERDLAKILNHDNGEPWSLGVFKSTAASARPDTPL